jgi:hypothetical protein
VAGPTSTAACALAKANRHAATGLKDRCIALY